VNLCSRDSITEPIVINLRGTDIDTDADSDTDDEEEPE
jgi:hypothetical protein